MGKSDHLGKAQTFPKQHTSTFFTNIRFDKPPVSDAGSVLDHKHLRPGLDVGRAARAEVEVKPGRQESAKCCPMAKTSSPGKVHLPEVFSIVHVEEIIEVSCPAKRKDDSFTIQRETWQHLVIHGFLVFAKKHRTEGVPPEQLFLPLTLLRRRVTMSRRIQ